MSSKAVLVGAQTIGVQFGAREIFSDLSLSVHEYEKIGLYGPNGAGKSTLLKILAGEEFPDHGRVSRRQNLRSIYLDQRDLFSEKLTLEKFLEDSRVDFQKFKSLFNQLENKEFPEDWLDRKGNEFSGGQKKKLAILKALSMDGDLFIFDEPTNHLDLPSILWLEEKLRSMRSALMLVSHDRAFISKICNRFVEIHPMFKTHPAKIFSHDGSWDSYQLARQEYLESLVAQHDSARNNLRRETEWLHRGPKARTTKQKARIDRAGELAGHVSTLKQALTRSGLDLELADSENSARKWIELKKAGISFGEHTVFTNISLVCQKGSRIGLLGPNGAGKTSLLQLITGDLEPTSGSVWRRDNIDIGYFSQNEEDLELNKTILRNVCPMGETVEFLGRSVHVRSFLQRFLFRGEVLDQPVSTLSGGERARLKLAKALLGKYDLFILDEPTNDLDFESLELLTDAFSEWDGVLILVSHDRGFLSDVCNQFVKLPEGTIYASLEQAIQNWVQKPSGRAEKNQFNQAVTKSNSPSQGKTKFSYKEKLEWDSMEETILKAEQQMQSLTEQMEAHSVSGDREKLRVASKDLELAQAEVERLYTRWAELGQKS